MKQLVLLIFLLAFPLSSWQRKPLFLPREDHPFVLNSQSGGFQIDRTNDIWPGVLSIHSDGDGLNVQVTAHDLNPFSLKEGRLVLWVKGENVESIKEFWLYAGDDNDFSNRIVYMITNDKGQLRENLWTRISLPLSAGNIWGEPDLKEIRAFQFWLNDWGSGPASVEVGPMYIERTTRSSAVVLTFDDGWKSQIDLAAPVMGESRFKGTAYIIPELIGVDGYMDEDDLRILVDEYGWSLGSHHKERMDSLSQEELREIFSDKEQWFRKRLLEAPDFSYPNGAFGGAVLDVVRDFYRSGRTILEFPEALPPGDPYMLKVLNIYPPVDYALLEDRLDRLGDRGELLILVFHKIVSKSEYDTELTLADFKKICRIVSESGAEVETMEEISDSLIMDKEEFADWYGETLFQEKADGGRKVRKVSYDWGSSMLTSASSGYPRPEMRTQIDFSLDWRMVWNVSGDQPAYYTQLDDLFLYVQDDLSDSARLYASAGMENVNFEDFSRGSFGVSEDGSSQFSVDTLYLKQDITPSTALSFGYYSPDPINKWVQVTRSARFETAFGQDMTPRSLWMGGSWMKWSPLGFQAALVPDVVGKEQDGRQVMTYQDELGVPNLFASLWWNRERTIMEAAAALNGDALKIAGAWSRYFEGSRAALACSLGAKYTKGQEFDTYPVWDHVDRLLRISAGISVHIPLRGIVINPGTAYKINIYHDGEKAHSGGLDLGIIYDQWEFYTVFSFYDLQELLWTENAGFEAGLVFDFKGVEYIAGYTMSGFHGNSGLYNNKSEYGGGIDGPFLRVKATYW